MSTNIKLVLRECRRRRDLELDLSQQDITILPEELFALAQLRKLDLSGNHLTTLEKKMELLGSLESIDLRNNSLSEFPVVLLFLPKLRTVRLSGNSFADQWAFLNRVPDTFETWRFQAKAVFEKSTRNFEDDFFTDDEIKSIPKIPSCASKMSDSDEKRSLGSKNTACQDDKDILAQLRHQIERLTAEKEVLETKLMSTTRTDNWSFGSSTGSNWRPQSQYAELQLQGINEVHNREKISQGGFSIIEKGIFRGTTVVVKRFFDPTNSSETRDEFLNEAKVLNRLRHPNIVTLMGVNLPTNAADSFLVLEYIPGGNLYDALHVRRIKFDKKAFLVKLAETMHFIHASGICHKDLKSLNVLLDGKGMPKVVDFGLARFNDGLNKGSMKFAATPSYSAPELFIQKELTSKVDVYAFGVLMWEVLMEDVPHRSTSPAEIKKFVMAGNVLDVKSLGAAAAEIIRSCCAFEPERRPAFEKVVDLISKARF
jgi:tRNA A-37 threonylcarbamoyl transferase component Bud32